MEDEQINTGYVETELDLIEPVDEYGGAEPYTTSLIYNDSNVLVYNDSDIIERFDYDNFNASDASKLVDLYVDIQYRSIIDTIRDMSNYQGLREVQFNVLPENVIKLKNKGFLVKDGVISW